MSDIIRNDSAEDMDAMEALDMAMGIQPKTDVWVCTVCGYEYSPELGDPDNGIAPGTAFEDLPEDWTCPLCGVPKSKFEPKVEINEPGQESWTNA